MPDRTANPHKQGEHVFNDIAGAVRNAFEGALRLDRANSLVLTGPYGPVRLCDLPSTSFALDRLGSDPAIEEARTVVAEATGIEADLNSVLFSRARLRLERLLGEVVVSTAVFLWRKKPAGGSSFHEFEQVVAGLHDKHFAVTAAKSAFHALMDAAHDPSAEASALNERVNESELERRRIAIEKMRQHLTVLKAAGAALIETFANELEHELERRVSAF